LQVLARAGRLCEPAMRSLVIPQLASLLDTLIRTGWFFRDVRLSNLVLDGGVVRLIDVGSARRGRSDTQSRRMLAVMLRGIYTDGAGAGATNCARLLRLHFGSPLRTHRDEVRRAIELAHHV
jgi:serine/threonine protein kinase